MKTLKHFSFYGLALMLCLTSCSTMDKRLYMSGYHVEWNKNKHNSNNQQLVNKNTQTQSIQNKDNVVDQAAIEINTISTSQLSNDNNITASIDNAFTPAVDKPASFHKSERHDVVSSGNIAGNAVVSNVKEIKNKPSFSEKKNDKGSFLTSMSSAKKAGVGLYILAFLIPFLAVGIHTGWKKPTLYCFLWSLLGWLPGIIHAFIQLGK